MLWRINKLIYDLKNLLSELESDPDRLDLIGRIHDIQIDKIKCIEKKIKRLKKLERNESVLERIEEYRRILRAIRSFGDAMAMLYIPTWNLKPMAYHMEGYKRKQGAGNISGKDGVAFERQCLQAFLDKKIPCVMCDLTMGLRYGDICLLGAGDPMPVECKNTAGRLNQRGRRQLEYINRLVQFYINDQRESGALKGVGGEMHSGVVLRRSVKSTEKVYVKELNALIGEVIRDGFSSRKLEDGQSVYAFLADKVDADLSFLNENIEDSFLWEMHEYAVWCDCVPYKPYVLILDDVEKIIKVLAGEILIFVKISTDVMGRLALKRGVRLEMTDDELYPIELVPLDNVGKYMFERFCISNGMIERMLVEFISLNWVINNAIDIAEKSD